MPLTIDTFPFETPRVVRDLWRCHFYHTIDLPGVGTMRGDWDLRDKFDEYIGGVDLEGKRVLDVGTASGFLSFEAEKRGAAEVVSFDISDALYQHCLPFRENLYYRDHDAWLPMQNEGIEAWKNGYWMAHRLLGSRAKCFYGNIYDMPRDVGTFDVVIVGSVWEHLSDQVSALGSVARLTADTMVFVTHLLHTEEPVAHFLGDERFPANDYCWWAYSLGIYRKVLAMIGFEIASVTRGMYRCELTGVDHERSTVIARRIVPLGLDD